MTSAKQVSANKENAMKSTGPKSDDGKIQVAGNAIKHGILSQQLILPGEDHQAFIDLQDDLRLALRPLGTLELILVEKIAVVIWKQKRLTAANSASIQLATRPETNQVRGLIDKALGGGYVSVDDLSPLNEEDNTQIEWCKEVVAEIESLTADDLVDGNAEILAKKTTLSYKQLCEEAKEDEVSPAEYLNSRDDGLMGWAIDLKHWCKKELEHCVKREKIQPLLQLAQTKETAHLGIELMNRYQATMDNELYRAMDALRKQQDWRLKNGIDLEAEVITA